MSVPGDGGRVTHHRQEEEQRRQQNRGNLKLQQEGRRKRYVGEPSSTKIDWTKKIDRQKQGEISDKQRKRHAGEKVTLKWEEAAEAEYIENHQHHKNNENKKGKGEQRVLSGERQPSSERKSPRPGSCTKKNRWRG
jgi:hypothetical protein